METCPRVWCVLCPYIPVVGATSIAVLCSVSVIAVLEIDIVCAGECVALCAGFDVSTSLLIRSDPGARATSRLEWHKSEYGINIPNEIDSNIYKH